MTEAPARRTPVLDEEQAAVVEAPSSARLLVTAGPGTGKTFTLLRRAEWLIDVGGLDQSDLLILSFSRAAVETVARRSGEETDLGRLHVRTVDSFAARLLLEAGGDVEGRSFDQRVVAVEDALEADPELLPRGRIRHVLIDEAQDVVGARARFVARVLEQLCEDPEVGFTVFGDMAQAIYDFQMDVRDSVGPRLLERLGSASLACKAARLSTNYRMSDDSLAEYAATMGKRLRQAGSSEVAELLELNAEHIRAWAGWTRPQDAAPEIRASCEAPGRPTVAVLTRNNAEALSLGAELAGDGLGVRVQHRAVDRGAAPWIAMLFGDAPVSRVPVPDVTPGRGVPWMCPPTQLMRILRQAGVAGDREVDLDRLAAMVRCGSIPEELVEHREAPVTVSTIHRAKGLEFDTVYAVIGSVQRGMDGDLAEEARILYVAATRARGELYSGTPIEWDGPVSGFDEGRVKVCSWNKPRRPRYLEVRVSDFDSEWVHSDRDGFRCVQDLLRDGLEPGTPMELVLRPASGDQDPVYELVVVSEGEPVTVGRSSPEFGAALTAAVLGRPPTSITGLVAEIPDTVSMNAVAAERAGLAEHGLHLRARAFGLGRLRWGD